MGKSLGNILKGAANVVLPNMGFAGGFSNGLIQGQGLGGALKQGAGSGLQAGASLLAPGAGTLAGAGISGLAGYANARLNNRDGLTGALSAAAGNYIKGSDSLGLGKGLADTAVGRGISDAYDAVGNSAIGRGVSDAYNSVGTSLGDVFGHSAGTPMSGGLQGPTEGSGVLGSVTRATSGLGSALGSGTGGAATSSGGVGFSSYLPAIAGGLNSMSANDKAQKDLLEAQRNSMNVLQPYLNSGTAANSKLSDLLGTSGNGMSTDEILASDPSYKFQQEQGEQALGRMQAARGGYFSGSAIKQGLDFNNGLSNKTVNDYYGRLSQQSAAGQQAANSAGQIYGDTGSAKANAGIASANITNQTLGSLFGSGAYGRKYDPYTGKLL